MRFRSKENPNYIQQGEVILRYTLDTEPYADNYSFGDIELYELFEGWVNYTRGQFVNDMVPIYWTCYILRPDKTKSKPENPPWQRTWEYETFDDYIHPEYPINWMACKVEDREWSKTSNSFGFIQSATDWIPSPLQETVWLPNLMRAGRTKQVLVELV